MHGRPVCAYIATYGVAHVHRSSLDYHIYDTAVPRGSASIPVSTCIGFRVLLRPYSWYVYPDTLSILLMQTTAETETHDCPTSRLRVPSPTARSVQYSIHHVFLISITTVAVGFIQIIWIVLAIPPPWHAQAPAAHAENLSIMVKVLL